MQYHGREAVVVNPPAWPLERRRSTASTACRSRAGRTPSYGRQRIPAFEVVKDSIQIMRGCFGGCAFCSITLHEGRVIQSRSEASVLDGNPPHGRAARLLGHDQRPGRADRQHVPDELHAAGGAREVPAGELPVADDLPAAGDRSRAA